MLGDHQPILHISCGMVSVFPLNLQFLEDRLKVTFKCGEGIDGDLCGVFFDGDGDFGWGIGNAGHVLLQPLERLFFICAMNSRDYCTMIYNST